MVATESSSPVPRRYTSVDVASTMPGLRIAFSRGLPGPWSEAVRAIFDIKRIAYVAVEQEPGGANDALLAWTGTRSAPVAILNDERPRAHWSEMLILAELLCAAPSLIPADERQRAEMFGLCHEICGEDGFGWSARALAFAAAGDDPAAPAVILRQRFVDSAATSHAVNRMRTVIGLLADQLGAQRAAGSDFLVGDSLSAADIYWTTFSNFVSSMRHEECPMPPRYRTMAEVCSAALEGPLPGILIDHRERILHTHFSLPMWF